MKTLREKQFERDADWVEADEGTTRIINETFEEIMSEMKEESNRSEKE